MRRFLFASALLIVSCRQILSLPSYETGIGDGGDSAAGGFGGGGQGGGDGGAGNVAVGWLDGFSSRQIIDITVQPVFDQTLTGFVMPIVSKPDALEFDEMAPNGLDIRFTTDDGTTMLPSEVELLLAPDLVAWFKLPELDPDADTFRIYMYYGNTQAPPPVNPWGDYAAVYHLGDGNGAEQSDSAEDALHSDTPIAPFPGAVAKARVGFGLRMNGGAMGTSVQVTTLGSELEFGNESFSVSVWASVDDSDFFEQQCPIRNGAVGLQAGWALCLENAQWGVIAADAMNVSEASQALNDFTGYRQIVGTVDRMTETTVRLQMYVDATAGNPIVDSIDAIENTSAAPTFGPFGGTIDELRIYRGVLSRDRITVERETILRNDDWVKPGSVERAPTR